jgi:hypothetical protein
MSIRKEFTMENRFAYGTEITFINGNDLQDYKMPSLNILANGEETEFYIIPFRAYSMNILSHNNSYSNGMSDTDNYERIIERCTERHDREYALDILRITMTNHIKECLESFENCYGKGGNVSGLNHVALFHEEVEKFIKRCITWVEVVVDGKIKF